MASAYDNANNLVVLGETRRYEDAVQEATAVPITDPNAEADPAAVGVPLNGAKSLLLEVHSPDGLGYGSARLWLLRKTRAAGGAGWYVPPGGDLGAIDPIQGYGERMDVSGFARAYVEVYDAGGSGLRVVYGRGVSE